MGDKTKRVTTRKTKLLFIALGYITFGFLSLI
jgi:hypothetical protein